MSRTPQDPDLSSDLAGLDRDDLLALAARLRDQVNERTAALDRAEARLSELESALRAGPQAAPPPPPRKRKLAPVAGAAYSLVFDGGSVNNPGRGYGSYQVVDARGALAAEASLDFGMGVSNNVAEYRSLIAALERVLDLAGDDAPRSRVSIRGDSQLVIRQVKGEWKVNNADLKPLHARARDLLARLGPADIQWHGRDKSVRILGH